MLLLLFVLAPLWVPIVLVRISLAYATAIYEGLAAYFTKWTP